MRRMLCVAIATLFATAAANAGPNLITNGGFETGSFAPWISGGNNFFDGVDTSGFFSHSGVAAGFFGAVGSPSTLSQSFISPGGGIQISFWLSNLDSFGGPSSFEALLNGNPLLPASINPGPFDYTKYTFDVVTPAGANNLTFRFRNDPSFFLLDDVSVTALPEPASMAIFGGLIAIGSMVARRRMVKSGA